MFIGEYQHSIDLKKRLAVPSKFRSELKNKVVITRGLDKCLFIYPMKVWEELAGKLGTLPVGESSTRGFIRLMLAGALDCEIDKQGRVLVPDFLKEYAGLDRNVIIAGVYNRLEIWDDKKWENYKKNAEKNTDEIAEQLGRLGVY
jgi:MraZ protein